jgi:hypothetical protein
MGAQYYIVDSYEFLVALQKDVHFGPRIKEKNITSINVLIKKGAFIEDTLNEQHSIVQ